MTDIKIRDIKKGTIKTIDKSLVASEKMKTITVKTKSATQMLGSQDSDSETAYASDNITRGVNNVSGKTVNKAEVIGKKSMIATRNNIIKVRNISQKNLTNPNSIRVNELSRPIVKRDNVRIKKTVSGTAKAKRTRMEIVRHQNGVTDRARKVTTKSVKTTKQVGKNTVKNVKRTAKATMRAVKLAAAGIKALVSALIAAGCIGVIVIIICCLFGAAFYFFGDESSKSYEPVSTEVQAYTSVIEKYASEEGIGEYVELIKAIMMQESAGKGKDPMQCSESPYNTKYSRKPGGIINADYSIKVGVKSVKEVLAKAKVESPIDMEHIRLALQGYNYGSGYIDWAIKKDGGYTVQNANDYSDIMAERTGWISYGDKQYVSHVLRYYPYGSYNYGVGNTVIVNIAKDQIGNKGGRKFWSWYGFKNRVDWCGCFVSWCADQCGYIKEGIIPKFAYVPDAVNWFKSKGQWQNRNYLPAVGDIVFFDWEGDGSVDHVGIVEKCEGGVVHTIEGNSGDICARRQYAIGQLPLFGYGVPKY